MNRDGRYFHRPESFLPERWLAECGADLESPFFGDRREALRPFSVGPWSCVGQHLAWAEMRLILARLLWTLDFWPAARQREAAELGGSEKPPAGREKAGAGEDEAEA